MSSSNQVSPAKTPVYRRHSSLLQQTIKANEQMAALVMDPLMSLSRAIPLLGDPGYTTVRSWIKSGDLRVWRAGRGHFRVRLSEIKRFLASHEVNSHG